MHLTVYASDAIGKRVATEYLPALIAEYVATSRKDDQRRASRCVRRRIGSSSRSWRVHGSFTIKYTVPSNNPYNVDDIAGLGRRPRLDGGVLGLITVEVHSSREAAALLQGPRARGLTAIAVPEVVVTAGQARISAGIDGESVLLDTPVQCRVRVAALRVRVPRQRPGAPAARQALTLGRLLRLAGPGHLDTTGSGT